MKTALQPKTELSNYLHVKYFAGLGHVDFLDCETETSKCFEPKIWLKAIRMSYNDEPVKKPYKLESFVINTCITLSLYSSTGDNR